MEPLDYTKKVLLVGDGAVGKTSLVRKYVHDIFSDRYIATIGTKTTRKEMTFDYEDQGVQVKLDLGIWDILGQEGIEHSHQIYFKGADGFIAVCDLTRPETVGNLRRWAARVREECGEIPLVVAANKVDLVGARTPGADGVDAVAKELGARWWRTSAKTGENVETLFFELGVFLCGPIVEDFAAAREGGGARRKGGAGAAPRRKRS